MATESGPDQLEETWEIIVSHVMEEGDATTDTTVRSAVLNSLKQRGSLIIDILKSKKKTDEIVKTIQEFDRYEQRWNTNDNAALSKDQEESIFLSMSQLHSLRQNMAIVKDLPWRNPHFQQLIPEDDQKSIEEKPTTVEKDIKRYQFLTGLPVNFFFDKIFPTLEELDFKDLSLNFQKILNVEDTGEPHTFQDVMNIVNLRKLSHVLFGKGVIQETELADLCSNSTRRETKLEILNYIGWDSLLSALKETYPHYHSALIFGTPSSLEHGDSDDNLSSVQLTDESHGLPKDNSRSYRQSPEWCRCMECREMSTEGDQICCRQSDCLSKGRLMDLIFLGAGSFKRHFMPKETLAERHRCVRQIIYKQLSVWIYNRLGPGVREPIPSCCIWEVRRKFPDPKGKYNGFKKSRIERNLENKID